MRRARIVASALALILLTPAAAALLPEPATEVAAEQDRLFRIINGVALVIGVIVELLLIGILVKFYKNRNVPRNESHRGHTKAEIAWTIAPVAILVFIAYQSVVLMDMTDRPVEDVLADEGAIEIGVVGHQFSWEFRYPEGRPTFNELRVEEGRTVLLNITAADVGHAFSVPELGLMADAWPSRTNHLWFKAPAYKSGPGDSGGYIPKEDANTYFVQCREYCGTGHAYMHAKIVVFQRGSQPLPYGSGEPAVSTCEAPLDGRELVPMSLAESGGPGGGQPWSIDPSTLTLPAGSKVRFEATIDGSGVHNLALLGPVGEQTPDFQPPAKECLDVDLPAEPQQIEYICAVPGHAGLGMRGMLTLT